MGFQDILQNSKEQLQEQCYFCQERKSKFISFVIPSVGRKTIINTIQSIKNNTIEDWEIVIVFDNVPKNKIPLIEKDPRIFIINIPKLGIGKNSAGNVRNVALKLINSHWAGFVDDDDTISIDYVCNLQKEILTHPQSNVVVFKLFRLTRRNRILPPPNQFFLRKGRVGISFCVNRKYYQSKNIYFQPSKQEDWYYLRRVKILNGKILISRFMCYFVNIPNTNKLSQDISIKSLFW